MSNVSNLQYFLSWFADHWVLGIVSLLIICITLASCFGSVAAAFRRDRDEL